MKFKVSNEDTRLTFILKMFYLIPVVILSYIPLAIYFGSKEMGYPFKGLLAEFNRREWKAKKEKV